MLKYHVVSKKSPIDQSVKFYARLLPVTPIKLKNLAEHISEACTVTVHDVKAVLSALETQIIRELRNGNSVRLGDLGSFRPTISSKGTASADDFTTGNIKRVNVRFHCSPNMRFELSKNNPSILFQNEGEAPATNNEEGAEE